MQRLSFKYRSAGQEFPFHVAAPFVEGHPLTAGEAQALNQLRSERIRENCRPAFAAAAGSAISGVPSADALQEVQQRISRYDENFQFIERHEAAERPLAITPIQREALELARGAVPDGASDAEIELLAASIDLVQEATERVRVRAEVARSGIEAL